MEPIESKDLIEKSAKSQIKVYRRRWVILAIYILYCAANSFQWLEYSIITNIVMKFYDVDALDVDWTSIIYMAIYPVIVIPVSYVIDKKLEFDYDEWDTKTASYSSHNTQPKVFMFFFLYQGGPIVVLGLRVAALIGGLGTALAAAVKVFSLRKDRFFVVLIGQAIGSTAQVFVLCLPTKIAAVWFKPSEASTACALGVFGTQLGFSLGFFVPPTLVKNHDDVLLIGSNMAVLCWGLAVYMIPVSLAILFFFPRHPPLPPSVAQEQARKIKPPSFRLFLVSFKAILTQKGFICHMLAYGINIAVFASVGTLLNQFVLQYLPNSEEDVGRMAFIAVIGGVFGSLMNGVFLDKTQKYKQTTLFNYFMTAISAALFLGMLLLKKKVLMYFTYAMFGFFSNSYMSVGFEMAVEITYPLDESTGTGILNASTQAFGVCIVLFLGELNKHFGASWSLLSQVILLLVGTILTYQIPNKNRRQEVFMKCKTEENVNVNHHKSCYVL